MKRPVAVMTAILLLSGVSSRADAQMVKLSDVLVFETPTLKSGADSKAFEAHVLGQVAPAWEKSASGRDLHLLRADRGSRKGQYVLLRNQAGDFRLDLSAFANGSVAQTEYRLVSPPTAGSLPEVDVLGMHYIKVRPDRREAFERFVAEKLHPAVARLRPDLRLLYYKAVNGADAGSYVTVFALTTESRDRYWPKGSDSDDVRAAFTPARALADELRTYLVDGTYPTGEKFAAAVYESREWTDFVLVRF